jgi:hypothetical protein
MTPTPLQKRLGVATKLWSEEELREEFQRYIDEQSKQYDSKWEWEVGGWQMFPNNIGNLRMVVAFETRVDVRSDDCYEVDPKPRPWKIAYKSSWDSSIAGLIGNFKENSFETLDQARYQFAETAMRIEREFKEAGITKDSPRQGKCSSCGKISDYDLEKRGYSGMTTLRPYTQYDDVYDGCRGWD